LLLTCLGNISAKCKVLKKNRVLKETWPGNPKDGQNNEAYGKCISQERA
jgi:hypothetical protein